MIDRDITKCEELIIATTRRRGNGMSTPIRMVTEVFEKDGTLLATGDDCSYTAEEMQEFYKHVCNTGIFHTSFLAAYDAYIESLKGSLCECS